MLRTEHENFYCTPTLAEKIATEAERRGISRSRLIEGVLLKFFRGGLDE
jgi:hypothetical protein